MAHPRTGRRNHLSPAQTDLALDDIREMAVNVPDWPTLHGVADDPDGDKLIECAVAAQAEIIVSGDEHLLSRGSFQGIQILTPAAFVVLLSQES
ncbi:MAG: putative toxin-antitoxin system toxin component, family [Chloroflexi bacterium]|nr:putative toxin-antitoxin system toxin component, family [Chloroflexota bacterium]